jgi:cobalamin synthase
MDVCVSFFSPIPITFADSSSGYITSFFWYFALYGATVSYVVLYHRQQIASASVMVWKSVLSTLRIRRHEEEDEEDLADDIQNYKDVPEWIYFIVLVIAATIGMVGIGIYPTQTSPVVVIFGIIMPFIALIPVGLVQSVTGIQVALNVLAEFIGKRVRLTQHVHR